MPIWTDSYNSVFEMPRFVTRVVLRMIFLLSTILTVSFCFFSIYETRRSNCKCLFVVAVHCYNAFTWNFTQGHFGLLTVLLVPFHYTNLERWIFKFLFLCRFRFFFFVLCFYYSIEYIFISWIKNRSIDSNDLDSNGTFCYNNKKKRTRVFMTI